MRPNIVVHVVDNGEDAPQTVDLRVVAVDLGHYQDDGCQEQRKRQAQHQRVRRDIDVQQCLAVVDALDDPVR